MVRLAISPCPNDTFAFFGLLHHHIEFDHPLQTDFADIEILNSYALSSQRDICKISFHAYLHMRHQVHLLNAGSALGFGCGPLLVARQAMTPERLAGARIAIPGRHTTAALLLQLWLGHPPNWIELPFDQIMPAVAAGKADAGLIIHESRFTYPQHGLVAWIDLGEWWEAETGHPIPLGAIVAGHHLPEETVRSFDRALGKSIDFAWAHRDLALPFMQQHAQEMDTQVMWQHVELYVNEFTRDLGPRGHDAIDALVDRAQRQGLLKESEP